MADIKIDQVKAEFWIGDVKREIESVEETLKDVRRVCQTVPGENDSIFEMIEQTGSFLENSWNHVTSRFEEAWDTLEKGIGFFGKAGDKVQDAFGELKKIFD